MLVLGIDPGIANTGWGVVDYVGQKFRPVCYGVINTDPKDRLEHRVSIIAENISQIAQKYQVQALAMEDIFFAKNEVSAIGVAKVIGAVSYAAYKLNINVFMFTPLQIKIAITGYGKAEKKQVQEMVRLLLNLDKIPRPDHAADALSAAVCFCNTSATTGRLGLIR
ncbi:MAG: crossover junction endodeoxyribonuclease RuvC [Sphaerochaetaceae bacterium]|nr:crossover junction endodeoxyribonuclease RuvC [Sphaerochaetaceae bacterium]